MLRTQVEQPPPAAAVVVHRQVGKELHAVLRKSGEATRRRQLFVHSPVFGVNGMMAWGARQARRGRTQALYGLQLE
jgi:hypothetical protein